MACGVIEAGRHHHHHHQHHRGGIDGLYHPNPHLDLDLDLFASSSKLRSDDEDDDGCIRKNCFMIVDLVGCGGYLLYKIDLLHHLLHHDDNLSSLRPLLFVPSIHNFHHYFNCIKLGSKFYFFGLDLFDGGFHDDYDDESFTSVYTLEEKDLMCIQPSEHNNVNNFKHLFTKINNLMHSHKYHPTLFVANQKLYVISHYCPRNSSFEVFSPSDQTWQVLPSPPYSKGLTLDVPLLVLEQEQTVFFCDFLFSFNLQTNTWTPTADSIYYPDSDDTPSHPPTFHPKRVSLIGDMAFGFRCNEPEGNYVCASRTTTTVKELMQPNLAPDQAFLEVLRSSRFTYMNNKDDDELYSDYIVALQDLDGKQVICIVTYGTKPAHETGCYLINAKTSYVALTFFDIPGDFYTSKDTNLHSSYAYADDTAEDGGMARRYFNAKFRHTAHFVVTNSHISTHGHLETCFF